LNWEELLLKSGGDSRALSRRKDCRYGAFLQVTGEEAIQTVQSNDTPPLGDIGDIGVTK
jgi:hypothetical protein